MTHTPDPEATPAIGDRIRHEFDGGVLVSTITAIDYPQGPAAALAVYTVEPPRTRDDELLLWRDEFTVLGPEPDEALKVGDRVMYRDVECTILTVGTAQGVGGQRVRIRSIDHDANEAGIVVYVRELTRVEARAEALEAARPIRRGDTVLASVGRNLPPVRGEVVGIVEAKADRFTTVVIRDAAGAHHATTLPRCVRVPADEVNAERMRRLHEAATARAAAYRIALERIVRAKDEPSMAGWIYDVENEIDEARELLSGNEPEAKVSTYRIALEAIARNAPSCDSDRTKAEYAADVAREALAEEVGAPLCTCDFPAVGHAIRCPLYPGPINPLMSDGPGEDEPWLGGLRPDGSRR